MSKEYSVEVCRELEAGFHAAKLYRPMRISRYDAGTELTYDVSGVGRAETAKVHLLVEKFVGGGFAGQVYRVKVKGIEGAIDGLQIGKVYAIKILIPPSGFFPAVSQFAILDWVPGAVSTAGQPGGGAGRGALAETHPAGSKDSIRR